MKRRTRSLLDDRLAKTAACLESLDQHRKSHADPNFGRSFEKGLIWDELLDLELQEFEEEMRCQSEAAHSHVPNAGTTAPRSEIPQQPQGHGASSPWWRLNKLFR